MRRSEQRGTPCSATWPCDRPPPPPPCTTEACAGRDGPAVSASVAVNLVCMSVSLPYLLDPLSVIAVGGLVFVWLFVHYVHINTNLYPSLCRLNTVARLSRCAQASTVPRRQARLEGYTVSSSTAPVQTASHHCLIHATGSCFGCARLPAPSSHDEATDKPGRLDRAAQGAGTFLRARRRSFVRASRQRSLRRRSSV